MIAEDCQGVPLELIDRTFSPEELEEIFPNSPLREVAFEIRFAPKLRVAAELWRLQEQLSNQYPIVAKETEVQPNGSLVEFAAFQSTQNARVIKVSHQSFLIAFTHYTSFEEYKAEVIKQTDLFCETFDIDVFTRIGLRYVNEITLPDLNPLTLTKYIRPIINFDSFPPETVNQFAIEMQLRHTKHPVTLRAALLSGSSWVYVLDIDCHSGKQTSAREWTNLLDQFHDSAQRIFLDHITEEYKQRMRGMK